MILGVCVHPSWSDTIYADHGKILDAVERLGFRLTRGASVHDVSFLAACHERGLNVIITADPPVPDEQWGVALVLAQAWWPGTIIAVEGLNEPDLYADSYTLVPWPVYTHSHQAALRAQVTGVPLLAPSIGHAENYAQAPNLSGLCDAANVHHYGGDVEALYDAARALAGAETVWVTETDDISALGLLAQAAAEVACRYQLCAPAKRHSFLWWKWWVQDWPEEDRYGLFQVSRGGTLVPR